MAPASPPLAGGGQNDVVIEHFLRLVSILDPNELYQAIVDSALALTGTKRGLLTLLEAGNKLRFKFLQGLDQQELGGPGFSNARNVIKQVLQTGMPVFQGPAQSGGTYVLCAPLKFGKRLEGQERIGGALYADIPQTGGTLGDAQLKMLESLAKHSAIALENAHIFHNSEQGRGEILRLKDNITKLYDVGRSISSTLILEELLSIVCEHVVQISRAQRGFVMLFEAADGSEEKSLVFKVGRDARKRALTETQFQYSSTLCKKAIEKKATQIMLQPMGQDLSVSMVEMELQSIMVVPLVEKENVIGLVYVDSQQSNREFDKADQEILESLCGQAAVALTNAKLYEDAGDRERLAHELQLAAKLQADLLPKEIPPVDGLEMYGLLYPALEVGGDYYDFVIHEGTTETITIVVGDVSGKGTGAGIVMAMARSALRSLVAFEGVPTSPLPIVKSLNAELCRDIPASMFITVNILIWDNTRRSFKYAPAGHEHLIIYRAATRTVETIKAGGVACGVLKQASAMYQEKELTMAPGDHLLLYTDGVTEAMDEEQNQFSLETTVKLVEQHGHLTPKALCEGIYQSILQFRGAADPHDDITLVALRAI